MSVLSPRFPVSRVTVGMVPPARRVIALTRRIAAAWSNRRSLTLLAQMDDHALGDIGLCRSDVHDALAQRWWDDPTALLALRRQERRAAQAFARLGDDGPSLVPPEPGFTRPATDRPARYTV